MKKHKCYWVSTTVCLVMLISATAGCITVTTPDETVPPTTAPEEGAPPSTTLEEAGPRPVINQFTATPEAISAGQTVTLSWDVSDATAVVIQPSLGDVGPSGSQQLSPATSTTYTLTATNAAGNRTGSLTVTVTAAVSGKPDLVVTEVWLAGNMFYYKIKNQGDGDAKSSQSELHINEVQKDSDWMEAIAAGQELIGSFNKYQIQTVGGADAAGAVTYKAKVCVDVDDAVEESNEGNNCGGLILGETFSYDFMDNAHLAEWRSGAGELKWPMVAGDAKGAALFSHSALEDGTGYAKALATYPRQASGGSIQGTFGSIRSKFYATTDIAEVRVPEGAKFTAMVGFKEGATATDGVTVAFGYMDPSGAIVFLKRLDVYYDGVLDVLEVPLSGIAGEEVYFVLRVEAGESWEQDWLVWVEPKIEQLED